MKIMQALVLTLFSFMLQSNAFGISIVYSGFECLNAVDTNDSTPKGIPVQSKFEVIQDAGDGIYRLSLTAVFLALIIIIMMYASIMRPRSDIQEFLQ